MVRKSIFAQIAQQAPMSLFIFLKKIFYLFIFREEEEERERERLGNIDVWEKQPLVASHMLPTRNLAHTLGMCPDTESNWQYFGL